jgi:hypothetical protein
MFQNYQDTFALSGKWTAGVDKGREGKKKP